MTKIYLIRHGEAEGNIYRRAHGHYDGRITAKGLRQIDALAERFRDVPVDALYSSDLRRTMATAGAITKYHPLEIIPEPRLREVNMGSWEDIPWGNLTHDYPEQMRAFNDDPARWNVPGGESFAALRERMRTVLREIAAKNEGKTVVCVTHGVAIRAHLSDVLGVPSEEIYRVPHGDNTHVSLLELDGDSERVVFYNDASHLTEELSTFSRQSWWKEAAKSDSNNLRFEPLDPNLEPELYTGIYRKTWLAVHGTERGFSPGPYLESARYHRSLLPDAILKAIKDGTVIGLTELDPARGKSEGYGWISLCFVEGDERRRLLGVQLLGHAVSTFRRLGRRSIRLHVFEGNAGAIAFYREYGFREIGRACGALGQLLLMEKDIS